MIFARFKAIAYDSLKFVLSFSLLLITPAPVNAAAKFTPKPSSKHSVLEELQGVKSPKGNRVYFEGKVDVYGREMIYAVEMEGKNGYYERGVVEKSGQLRWIQYSNYQAVKFSEKPLPSNRALVLTDSVIVTGNSTGSGQAEISSKYFETIKSNPNYKAPARLFMPSQLKAALDWSDIKTKSAKGVIDRMIYGRGNSALSPAEQTDVTKKVNQIQGVKAFAAQMGAGATLFYVAIGMISAFYLMTAYPSNPMAWDSYLKKLTDPMGWLMLVGFLAAAYPFLSRVTGTHTAMGVIKAVPLYAAGIVAGVLANGLIYLAADEDVRKCTGVFNPGFERDMAACDKAYESWAADKTMLAFAPPIATVFAAGGIFLGGAFLVNITGLGSVLRATAGSIKNTKAGGLVGLAMMVGSGLMFLGAYEIAEKVLLVEKNVREWLVADQGLFVEDPYGASIRDTENNLYLGWEKLKANGWQDTATYDKTLPNQVIDYDGVLARYRQQLAFWRSIQFTPAYSQFDQWAKKVEKYHKTVSTSYTIYKDFIERIAYEKQNSLSPTDARGFNPTYVAEVKKLNTNGSAYEGRPDSVIVADPITTEDFSGYWKYVDTRNIFDFMVTSMACGPEAEELRAEGNLLLGIGEIFAVIGGNTSPDKMVVDPLGREVKFMPPRIVNRLQGSNGTACEEYTLKSSMDFMVSTTGHPPENIWVGGQLLFAKLPAYPNLYEYIKDNVRESVMKNGKVNFDAWWKSNVLPQLMVAEEAFRKEYEVMLTGEYTRALSTNEYYWQSEGPWKTSLSQFLEPFLVNREDRPSAAATHRLAKGIINSMEDELRIYLAMLSDVFVSVDPSLRPQVITKGQNVMRAFGEFIREMKIADRKQRRPVNELQMAVVVAVNEFYALEPPSDYLFPTLTLQSSVQTLLESLATYYTVVSTFESEAPIQELVADSPEEQEMAPTPPADDYASDPFQDEAPAEGVFPGNQ